MPIQFRCHQCRHLLQTGDETEGKQARCPQCGTVQDIPFASQLADDPPLGLVPAPVRPAEVPPRNPFAESPDDLNPYSSSHVGYAPRTPSVVELTARVQAAAIGLILTALIGFGFAAMGLLGFLMSYAEQGGLSQDDYGGLAVIAVTVLWNSVILAGGIQMYRLKSHGLATTAAIFSVLPCSLCWCLQISFGVWALVVLANGHSRNVFS